MANRIIGQDGPWSSDNVTHILNTAGLRASLAIQQLPGTDPGWAKSIQECELPWKCVERVAFEVAGSVGGLGKKRDPNDHYMHCVTSCEITKQCGEVAAFYVGDVYFDHFWNDPGLDTDANNVGIGAARLPGTCEDNCKAAAEGGLLPGIEPGKTSR